MQKPKLIFLLPVEMEPCMSVERELKFGNDSKKLLPRTKMDKADNTRENEIGGKLTDHFGCLTAGS